MSWCKIKRRYVKTSLIDLRIVIHRLLKRILVEFETMIEVYKLFHYLVLKYSIITNCSDVSKSNKISRQPASNDRSNDISFNY